MSNSSLVNYTKLSPNCTKPRKNPITKITVHHMAGNLTVEKCGEFFASSSRQASSNYGIGTDGRVGMYVEECNRSWCSGTGNGINTNDHMAVTIEVANDGGAPDWHVSDKAFNKLIDLCVDICKRNGIKSLNWTGNANGNLTVHRFFQNTACPGNYLFSKMPELAKIVNERLNPTLTGYIDSVNFTNSNLSVSGWVWKGAGSQPVTIKVCNGSNVVATINTNASGSRPDVKNTMKYSSDKVGFSVSQQLNLGNGTYSVKVFVGNQQLNDIKTFTVKVVTTPSNYDVFISEMRSVLGLPNGTPAQLYAKTPELRNTNKYNAATKPVQKYLNTLGFNCGTPDGYFGNNTEKAVKAYQTKYTGVADGVMSAKGYMWKHLLKA